MLKNRHLKRNHNHSLRNIFLKSCYIFTCIFLFSCSSKSTKEESFTKQATSKIEVKKTVKSNTKKIIFFGDSLTAGYGLNDMNDAYPGLIQQTIDSLKLGYTVINSGVSGETSAGGKNRINWVLNQKPDIFILELGANDGLRGVSLKETRKNLQSIINIVKEKHPTAKIILTGMQIPPNMGQEYTAEFKNIFPSLAKKNDIALIPFLLENVGGIAELNQSDGIHPTKEGHVILANNVWPILKPFLK
jgi:acyl-CoA thioesterase I